MAHAYQVKSLQKTLAYILGCRPDEFGLILDDNGFAKISELCKVLKEEGWSYVSEKDIVEAAVTDAERRFELKEGKIRFTDIKGLEYGYFEKVVPPRLLFLGIKEEGYLSVLHRGLLPPRGQSYIYLFAEKTLAERVAKRRYERPVLLEVLASEASQAGFEFFKVFPLIFATYHVPKEYVKGPYVREEVLQASKPKPVKALEPSFEVIRGKSWKEQAKKFRRKKML